MSKVARALEKDLTNFPEMNKHDAQEILDRINKDLRIAAEEITKAGYHVDMETGVGDNGLFLVKFVVNN